MHIKLYIVGQFLFILLISFFESNIWVNSLVQIGLIAWAYWAYVQIQKGQNLTHEENQKKLEQQAKLAALGEIAAGIAHEINNPVAIVHGKTQLIDLQIQESKESNQPINMEELEENVQDVLQTVVRIDKIINSLRYFVRDDSRNPLSWAKVEEILDNVQVLSIDRCKKHGVLVKLNKQINLEAQIYCKPTQISQVLINLINNSFDALNNADLKEKWIEVKCFENNEEICFQVIDSGLGIPKEAQSKILNTFYTSKATTSSSGMGIGLTIARRIVEQHYGSIKYLPNEKNTTFEVRIPKGKR